MPSQNEIDEIETGLKEKLEAIKWKRTELKNHREHVTNGRQREERRCTLQKWCPWRREKMKWN